MIGAGIAYVLGNPPVFLFAAAILIAWARRGPGSFHARLLDWLLLLSVGVQGIWAGVFHLFFPAVAAASIGWRTSPFQFEIGVADAAIGIAAIVSVRRGVDFKAAIVWVVVLFNLGVAFGHLRQAYSAHDYAPNNFGPLLIVTLLLAALLPWLLGRVRAEGAR